MKLEKTTRIQEASEKLDIRDSICAIEEIVKDVEGAYSGDSDRCPLIHTFSDGIYTREIFIPAGEFLVGKIHKHDHPNFLMQGTVKVLTESGGEEIFKAPCYMVSPAGTKRALLAETDLVWVTIHHNPTNTQDLAELESNIIAEDYLNYEKFRQKESKKIELRKGLRYKLKQYLIKKL